MSWESTVVFRGGFAGFLACPCVDVVDIRSKGHNWFLQAVCFLPRRETNVLLGLRLMYLGSLFPLPLPLPLPLGSWQVARIALRGGGACSLRARRHIYASPSYFQQKVSAPMCALGARL